MKKLYNKHGEMRVAAFMSGSGTTVRAIINGSKNYKVVFLFSDNPNSKIEQIAGEFKIPFEINDIKEFYKKKNAKLSDLEVRKEFDSHTKSILKKNKVDVVALAGYMSLVTPIIFDNFPTINSHPADLSIMQDGKRKYVGAHAVLDCVNDGLKEIRTSIILVNSGVDAGPILVRSKKVAIPNGNDKEKIANEVQENLKVAGDWPAYIAALDFISQGKVSVDGNDVFFEGRRLDFGYDLALA